MGEVSTMMIPSRPSPEWMGALLQTPFYGEKCKIHPCKYNTVFCSTCTGKPKCEVCWKNEAQLHQGHLSLQVCKASRKAAIEIDEIKKLWDTAYIQPYKINGKNIVYLNPNARGDGQNQNPRCQTCERRVRESNYRFCSIACKHQKRGFDIERANIRKSRKGIPLRAPLT